MDGDARRGQRQTYGGLAATRPSGCGSAKHTYADTRARTPAATPETKRDPGSLALSAGLGRSGRRPGRSAVVGPVSLARPAGRRGSARTHAPGKWHARLCTRIVSWKCRQLCAPVDEAVRPHLTPSAGAAYLVSGEKSCSVRRARPTRVTPTVEGAREPPCASGKPHQDDRPKSQHVRGISLRRGRKHREGSWGSLAMPVELVRRPVE